MAAGVLREMLRTLTPDGAIFYNHKWRVQRGLLQDRADIMDGFPVRQIIIWQRSGGFNHNPGYFLPTYEVIYLVANPEFRLAPKAGGIGDVWQIRQDRGNPHPASFPVELARRRYCCDHRRGGAGPVHRQRNHGDCRPDEGRRYIGIDLSDEYCRMARERIVAAAAELAEPGGEPGTDQSAPPSALEVREMLQGTPAERESAPR